MFVKCPTCPAITHVRPVAGMTEAEWIAEQASNTKPGEMPKVPCFECWKRARDKRRLTSLSPEPSP